MATVPVAKRYARALLDIGIEQGNYEKLSAQLQELSAIYEQSRELRAVLLNPSITLEERRAIVRKLVERGGWEPILRNFALLLLDKDRFRVIPDIAEEFVAFADEQAGNVRARVTSAVPLNDKQQQEIKQAIAGLTGKTVLLEADVDEELIGGVVTRVGSTVYDGSVRTQLQRMRESILTQV